MQTCFLLVVIVAYSLATPNFSELECQEACLKGVLLSHCPCADPKTTFGVEHPDYNEYEYEDDYGESNGMLSANDDIDESFRNNENANEIRQDLSKRTLKQYFDWAKRSDKKDDSLKGVFRWGKRASADLDQIYNDKRSESHSRNTAEYNGPAVVFRWGKRSDEDTVSPPKSVFRWGKRPDQEGYQRGEITSYETKPDPHVVTLYKDIIEGLATLRNYHDNEDEHEEDAATAPANALSAEKRRARRRKNRNRARAKALRQRNLNSGPKRGIFRWGKRTVGVAAPQETDTSEILNGV